MVLSKMPDTGLSSAGGTKYRAINTCIVRYYYNFTPDKDPTYRTVRLNTGRLATKEPSQQEN